MFNVLNEKSFIVFCVFSVYHTEERD